MKITTRYFGEITYGDEDIIHLSDGLFGFEEEKEYVLIHFSQESHTLLCLQSLTTNNLAFVLVNPFFITDSYKPVVSKEDMNALELTDDSPVTFYSICVMRDILEESTINLKCPIIINPKTRNARQIILDDSSYSLKHPFSIKNMKEENHC